MSGASDLHKCNVIRLELSTVINLVQPSICPAGKSCHLMVIQMRIYYLPLVIEDVLYAENQLDDVGNKGMDIHLLNI